MAYNQANNPFKRKTSSPLFNRTTTVTLPNGQKVVTSIDNTNLNPQGETQSDVVNRNYQDLLNAINQYNNVGNKFSDLSNLSIKEASEFDELENEALNNLTNTEKNFIRVSDSINNVNRRRNPINRKSPLHNTEDIQWNEELFDRGDMNYNEGEWGNETQEVLPNGDIIIKQSRDLDRQSGGEEFVHPDGLSWGEWLQTPEGMKWNEANTGQDTRSRIIKNRKPIRAISELSGEGITEVTGDEREPSIINTGIRYSDEDMERIKREMDIRKRDDERSNRRRKRKRFWSNIGGALGDVGGAIGRAGGFVLGNTGRSIVDLAAMPVDAVRGVIGACRTCGKGGIMDPAYLSIAGGNRGLTSGLFSNWRRRN